MRGSWLIVALALGCTTEPTASPEPSPPSTPRGPRGAAPVRCDGHSVDPGGLERFDARVGPGQLDGAIAELEALVGAHPGSATARARLGELLLRAQPPRAALATTWFDRALALHEEGCALDERGLWEALEGAALSRMMSGDYAAARPFLERSLERWPTVRATRYNLACVRCQTGDLDGCAAELGRTLVGPGGPELLGEQRQPADYYRDLARRDPDLAPLRADPRFEATLQSEAE